MGRGVVGTMEGHRCGGLKLRSTHSTVNVSEVTNSPNSSCELGHLDCDLQAATALPSQRAKCEFFTPTSHHTANSHKEARMSLETVAAKV